MVSAIDYYPVARGNFPSSVNCAVRLLTAIQIHNSDCYCHFYLRVVKNYGSLIRKEEHKWSGKSAEENILT
jgi:hypothetical protein